MDKCITKQELVTKVLSNTNALSNVVDGSAALNKQGKAYAPSNIALAKYWGKRSDELNLPVNRWLYLRLLLWDLFKHFQHAFPERMHVIFEISFKRTLCIC